jgi:predicted RNA polymerase sigma factor
MMGALITYSLSRLPLGQYQVQAAIAALVRKRAWPSSPLLDEDERLVTNHRLHAVRAYLLELLGDDEIAGSGYLTAAGLTNSETERDYLTDRAARLSAGIRGKPGCELGATRPTDSFGPKGAGQGARPARG